MRKVGGTVVGRAESTTLEAATFELPDGQHKEVAIVHRPDAVGALPVRRCDDGSLEVLVASPPRPAVGEEALLEIVAGKVEGDDTWSATMLRELLEEVGLYAHGWHRLAANLLPSPGFLREAIDIFVVWNLSEVPSRDEDAHISARWLPLDVAIEMTSDGRIRDMKTIIALLIVGSIRDELIERIA